MKRLQFVLFQMDEAKRLILEGYLPGLRVALLLLDNAAEVVLDRWIAADLEFDAMRQRIQDRAREAGVPEDHPDFADLFSQQFLTAKEKKQLSRVFDEKIRYVTVTKPSVSVAVGEVLLHLHRYRNEAYHSGRVKEETLHTSVVILLELCCQLVLALKPSASISSLDDYSWLQRRFGIEPMSLWNEEGLARVLDDLREGLPVDDDCLGSTLADNLRSRLEDTFEQLDFIAETANIEMDRAAALVNAQEYTVQELKSEPPYRSVPKRLDEAVSLDELEQIGKAVDTVRSAPNGVAAFEVFSRPDSDLERIDFMVGRLAQAIDEWIQMEIDAARGK